MKLWLKAVWRASCVKNIYILLAIYRIGLIYLLINKFEEEKYFIEFPNRLWELRNPIYEQYQIIKIVE